MLVAIGQWSGQTWLYSCQDTWAAWCLLGFGKCVEALWAVPANGGDHSHFRGQNMPQTEELSPPPTHTQGSEVRTPGKTGEGHSSSGLAWSLGIKKVLLISTGGWSLRAWALCTWSILIKTLKHLEPQSALVLSPSLRKDPLGLGAELKATGSGALCDLEGDSCHCQPWADSLSPSDAPVLLSISQT